MSDPQIKVEWEDTRENLTKERVKRVKSYFEQKYKSKNVKIIPKILSTDTNTKLKSLDVGENILDPQFQKKLMKDFIKENGMVVNWDLISRLDDKVNAEIDKITESKVRYNKWYIKKIEVSNFLSYGEDNAIDFTGLSGITVIESIPENFGGKTTLTIDALMFLFFNKTSKSDTNAEVFNLYTDVDEVKVKGYVNIDDEDYIISRIVSRKKTKLGEYTVKSDLEYSKINIDGSIENLSGEQRRETEGFIKTAIGTQEDFLSTILTTENNLEDLIESKPTARGQILTKFLGLEGLKVKEDICKTMYSEWSKKLVSNTYNITQLGIDNETFTETIKLSEQEIVKYNESLRIYNETLKQWEDKRDKLLGSRNNDIDRDLINTNPLLLKGEVDKLIIKKNEFQVMFDSVTVTEPSKFYNEEDHNLITEQLNKVRVESALNRTTITGNEKLITQMEKGEICPTCKRPLSEVDHSVEIQQLKNVNIGLEAKQLEIDGKINVLNEQNLGFIKIKKEFEEYEKQKLLKSKYELEIGQKDLEIQSKQLMLDRYEGNRKKLEENQKIDQEIIVVKTDIESIKGSIRHTTTFMQEETNKIALAKEKINLNLELIKKIKSEEDILVIFKNYLLIYGKNGISKVIMRNMIPLLNQELYRLLLDSAEFTLELSINDKNDLEFLMIDNETRIVKKLSAGSGYEKSISSLALRAVLTKVSSLPKPNIVVFDEAFGKMANVNLEMVGEFFKKIKNYFEHVFIISHNPLIINWGDNLIIVRKDNNISSIDSIITNIS